MVVRKRAGKATSSSGRSTKWGARAGSDSDAPRTRVDRETRSLRSDDEVRRIWRDAQLKGR